MSDLISRSALIEEFEERMQDDNVMCPVIKVLDVLEIIGDAPTVEARPVVHGEWKSIRDKDKKKCSVCGVIHLIAQYPFGNANFCPNCGADMRKKVQE